MSSKTQYKAEIKTKSQNLAKVQKANQLLIMALQEEKKKVKHLEEALARQKEHTQTFKDQVDKLLDLSKKKPWWKFWK